jgi:hypothetical protein
MIKGTNRLVKACAARSRAQTPFVAHTWRSASMPSARQTGPRGVQPTSRVLRQRLLALAARKKASAPLISGAGTRVPDRCLVDLRERGYLPFEGFREADELAAAQQTLWLHDPRPEVYFVHPAAHAWLATDQRAGEVSGPWRSWNLERSAFHPDLLDLAERFSGLRRPAAPRGVPVGQVRRSRRRRPAPPPGLRQPQPRRA